MRSILEKAFVALLNEEHDKAEEMFHKFIVERARQIHESNRAGEDFVLDENWEEEITTESYFTEEDLADLEDGEGEAGGEGDENPFAAADDAEGAEFGGDDAGADDAAGDEFGAADLGADDAEADLGADLGADDLDGGDASIESLEDKIDELTAKFEAMMDAIGADDVDADVDADADADAQADDAAADFGGDDEAGEVDAGALEDDMDGADDSEGEAQEDDAEQAFGESEESDDEFDDITESIIDELEKVQVSLTTDGVEIAAGKSFQQNKTSSIPQKSKDARQGGEPVKQKVTNHKHFNRETAPTVADMKARKNTLSKADSTQSKVSKEGDASAEINKIDSNGNNKSLTPGGKPGFKAK